MFTAYLLPASGFFPQNSTLNDTDNQQHTAASAKRNHQPWECLCFFFVRSGNEGQLGRLGLTRSQRSHKDDLRFGNPRKGQRRHDIAEFGTARVHHGDCQCRHFASSYCVLRFVHPPTDEQIQSDNRKAIHHSICIGVPLVPTGDVIEGH